MGEIALVNKVQHFSVLFIMTWNPFVRTQRSSILIEILLFLWADVITVTCFGKTIIQHVKRQVLSNYYYYINYGGGTLFMYIGQQDYLTSLMVFKLFILVKIWPVHFYWLKGCPDALISLHGTWTANFKLLHKLSFAVKSIHWTWKAY